MGKRNHVIDFTVDTNNQCFICFKKVSCGFSSVELKEAESQCSSVHSLQYLSRYLMLDMRKVFHEEDSIPPHLLAQVEKSRLKVELCEDCRLMNETFSKQYKQLEKIEMAVKSSMELMHWKFEKARETNKTAQFRNSGVDADDLSGKMDIANALRTETMEKCKRKLTRPSPLVRIQKLSTEELQANKSKSRRSTNPADFLNLCDNLAKVKSEISIIHPDQNHMEERDYFDDFDDLRTSNVDLDGTEYADDPSNEPTISNVKGAMQIIVIGGSAHVTPINARARNVMEGKKYTVVRETGKLKCNLCSMEFKRSGFDYHYQSIHLGIKYKCKLCGKEFSRRPNYNRHHKTAHLREAR